MIIASFDVGMSNLAYCILQNNKDVEKNEFANDLNFEILNWEVLDLNTNTLEEACRRLPVELHKRIDTLGAVDKVVIERQTKSNVKMKVMSHLLQLFFETHQLYHPRSPENPLRVEFVSPVRKLNVYTGPPIECNIQNGYRRNKRLAIEHTAKILEKYPVHVRYFHSLKKKDDAADAFLQGLSKLRECHVVSVDL